MGQSEGTGELESLYKLHDNLLIPFLLSVAAFGVERNRQAGLGMPGSLLGECFCDEVGFKFISLGNSMNCSPCCLEDPECPFGQQCYKL